MPLLIILDSEVETRNIAAPTNTPDYAKNNLIINKVTTIFFATAIVSLDTTLFTISTAEFRLNRNCWISVNECNLWQDTECSVRILRFDLDEEDQILPDSFVCLDVP